MLVFGYVVLISELIDGVQVLNTVYEITLSAHLLMVVGELRQVLLEDTLEL